MRVGWAILQLKGRTNRFCKVMILNTQLNSEKVSMPGSHFHLPNYVVGNSKSGT